MKKVLDNVKNHIVETIGLLVIVFLIIFISFLKTYKKTYVCTYLSSDRGVRTYQEYIIHQKNNNIKDIEFTYKVNSSNEEAIKQIANIYNEMIKENEDVIEENSLDLKYSKNKIIFTFKISGNELKSNDTYKSARHFVKLLKASKFTCK